MSGPRLLLVDDAPEIALIVQRFGRRAAHTVIAQPDAEAAWEHLQQGPRPDLVVLDLNLPGASGADLCRRLRGEPAFADLRVAFFSHWDRPADVLAGLDAGTNYVLSKDLLCQPDGWQSRLAEILPPAPGRPLPLSLRWWSTEVNPGAGLSRRLTLALKAAARQPLGEELVRGLIRRAAPGVPDALDGRLNCLPADAPPDTVRSIAIACAELMWCLLGTAASAPFRDALEATAPPAAEAPPCR